MKTMSSCTVPAQFDPAHGSSISGRKERENTNLTSQSPDVVKRLQAAYDEHVAEITANLRPTAEMVRPADALSPERPGGPKKKAQDLVY